ncbi:type II TA system antitoxin MqsA family protein [Burkholderia multivorans]|uniref:type II TA system antitoxin MqsA family protein n=1 Tax=Burkholderia multivorans TaxID=87883 RepID=UPI0009C09808|nr:type II TA system antitoxin MqsA family protein [Burkholderia multivorans]MBU9606824.1 type II toxin-antitoxin system MqsA family antitoxin [Burkholderia multivorans]MBU9623847.1 type II toxin-antitoxin system MqsA family antitoxin [Burkholderia multivorans]
MKNKEVCPVCGEGVLEERQDHVYTFLAGRQKHTVKGLVHSVCNVCETSLCTEDQNDRNVAKIESYQSALTDYISPEKIAALRARYGISQATAVAIFGGGPNAFSKYERGEVCPSAAAATLMLLALKSKLFFEALALAKGVEIKPHVELCSEFVKVGAAGSSLLAEVSRNREYFCEPVGTLVSHNVVGLDNSAKHYVKNEMIIHERALVACKRARRSVRGSAVPPGLRYVGQLEFDKTSEKKWNAIFH